VSKSIQKVEAKEKLRVAGLMSGTSVDGVDVAIIDITRQKVKLLAFDVFPYLKSLRKEILDLCNPKSASLDNICHYNFILGEVFADAIIKLCKKSGISLSSIDLVGSHGQTIFHNPRGKLYNKAKIRSTLQIGEPSVIAQRTGITTVADFRPRDLAAGGEGAPLVPYADYILFRNNKCSRAVQNIGGIANVTFLPCSCKQDDIIAFDTGPGNMIIDGIIRLISDNSRSFDSGGKVAARGKVNEKLLNEMLRHPFLKRRPPKSTGREEFGISFINKIYKRAVEEGLEDNDLVATMTAFTVKSIARAYHRFLPALPDEVILCGGGSCNNTLVEMLHNELTNANMCTTDDFGISVEAKEAVSFAILAWATIKGLTNNIPRVTGADRPVIMGKIIPA
jgi:anhydro-N-acetylmuramic acid kinase